MSIKVLVATGEGINAEQELARAFELSGAKTDIIHINKIISNPRILRKYQALCVPGGFAFGDHLGAGRALSKKIEFSKNHKNESAFQEIISFIESKKLVLGVCNGFQVLVQMGLFAGKGQDYGIRNVSLAPNSSGKFEDRWINLISKNSNSIFSKGINILRAPVRHGEGKVVFSSSKESKKFVKEGRIVFQYASEKGKVTKEYPLNPNGSLFSTAGISDKSGCVLGLMPHPEAAIYPYNDPLYTRRIVNKEKIKRLETVKVFDNAVKYLEKKF